MGRMPEPPPAVDLWIPDAIVRQLYEHCLREAPGEACGLLSGRDGRVTAIFPMRNAAGTRETRYEADSRDLITAANALRDRAESIQAIYHSHPRWRAEPSRTDLERNYHGATPHLIVSLLGPEPEMRAWRLAADSAVELTWRVAPPAGG